MISLIRETLRFGLTGTLNLPLRVRAREGIEVGVGRDRVGRARA